MSNLKMHDAKTDGAHSKASEGAATQVKTALAHKTPDVGSLYAMFYIQHLDRLARLAMHDIPPARYLPLRPKAQLRPRRHALSIHHIPPLAVVTASAPAPSSALISAVHVSEAVSSTARLAPAPVTTPTLTVTPPSTPVSSKPSPLKCPNAPRRRASDRMRHNPLPPLAGRLLFSSSSSP
jgi:hypothetical protein